MPGDDIFTAMVVEELNQYQRFFLSQERKLLDKGEYKKLAIHSLRRTWILGAGVIIAIIIFSIFSIYYFVQFGNHGNWLHFLLGIVSWFVVITSTVFYIRDIVEKKKCMKRVLKLMEAREEYFQESS
ncbi:MAG: hypothetical protein WEA56_04540 [Balneolaceae bacterium]